MASFNHTEYGQTTSLHFWIQRGCHCSGGRKCPNLPISEFRYDYVTGRAGRISDRRLFLCEKHAKNFRNKYLGGEK